MENQSAKTSTGVGVLGIMAGVFGGLALFTIVACGGCSVLWNVASQRAEEEKLSRDKANEIERANAQKATDERRERFNEKMADFKTKFLDSRKPDEPK